MESLSVTRLVEQLSQALTMQNAEQVALLAQAILLKEANHKMAYQALFTLYEGKQDFPQLVVYYQKYLHYFPKDAEVLAKLAQAYRFLQQNTLAIDSLQQALSLNAYKEKKQRWRNLLGVIYKEQGELALAKQTFEQCISENNKDFYSYYQRSELAPLLTNVEVDNFQHYLTLNKIAINEQVYIAYCLFKHYEYLKEFSSAFNYLSQMNELKRKQLSYHHQREIFEHRDIAQVFNKNFIDTISPQSSNLTTNSGDCQKNHINNVIFICGLPRSGTTLVEQIISSHSQVTAGDEIYALAQATQQVMQNLQPKQAFPWAMNELTAEHFNGIGKRYLQLTDYLQKTPLFTDKMLLNYKAIGLIRVSLPTAKIVVCQRNPMDLLIGCYKQLFGNGNKYTYNLDELSDVIIAQHKLIQHWQQLFPEQLYVVQYEKLITHQVEETKRLLEFLGIEFEQACVNFHQNQRSVHTLSNIQVRQPLFTQNVAQWQCYKTALLPYVEKFKQAGIKV